MASFSVCKEVLDISCEANVSLWLWGAHGIGKSSLVAQCAQEKGIGFIDLRCAQLDSLDLRGLPDKGSDGRTHFLPPAELPSDGEGVLFLDELNRASNDVMAALFQLVLDRQIGQYKLPPGWSIVAAGNFHGGDTGYGVNELDIAFFDRFCHVTLSSGKTLTNDWSRWMGERYGSDADSIVSFCQASSKHLTQSIKTSLPFDVTPSPRSWEAVCRGQKVIAQGRYTKSAQLNYIAGWVGSDLATSFINYRPTVTVEELVAGGISKVEWRLQKCSRAELAQITSALIETIQTSGKMRSHVCVAADYIEFLTRVQPDLAIACASSVLAVDKEFKEIESIAPLLTNDRLAQQIIQTTGNNSLLAELVNRKPLRATLAKLLGYSTGTN